MIFPTWSRDALRTNQARLRPGAGPAQGGAPLPKIEVADKRTRHPEKVRNMRVVVRTRLQTSTAKRARRPRQGIGPREWSADPPPPDGLHGLTTGSEEPGKPGLGVVVGGMIVATPQAAYFFGD